jgi:hypothetical protein
LIAIGDIAMNAGDAFSHIYLQDTLKILDSACKLSLQTVDPLKDEDLASYLAELRETIVETYTTLMSGVKDVQVKNYLANYAPSIITYLQ